VAVTGTRDRHPVAGAFFLQDGVLLDQKHFQVFRKFSRFQPIEINTGSKMEIFEGYGIIA
jgi:hypothetical protein